MGTWSSIALCKKKFKRKGYHSTNQLTVPHPYHYSSIPFWHTFPLYSFIIHYLVSPSIYIKKLVHMIFWCNVESILPSIHQKYNKSREMPITFCSHQKLALKGTYTFWKASCLSYFQHLSKAREIHPPCPSSCLQLQSQASPVAVFSFPIYYAYGLFFS